VNMACTNVYILLGKEFRSLSKILLLYLCNRYVICVMFLLNDKE